MMKHHSNYTNTIVLSLTDCSVAMKLMELFNEIHN